MRFGGPLIAALWLLGLASRAEAASPAEIAAGLAPEVIAVVSGGKWQEGDRNGGYRAVLVAPAGAVGAQLYIEWLAAGANGGAPSMVATVPVKEVNDLRLPNATLSAESETDNQFTVFVESDDPATQSGNSYTVNAAAPGKYTFSLGAPPE